VIADGVTCPLSSLNEASAAQGGCRDTPSASYVWYLTCINAGLIDPENQSQDKYCSATESEKYPRVVLANDCIALGDGMTFNVTSTARAARLDTQIARSELALAKFSEPTTLLTRFLYRLRNGDGRKLALELQLSQLRVERRQVARSVATQFLELRQIPNTEQPRFTQAAAERAPYSLEKSVQIDEISRRCENRFRAQSHKQS